MTMRFPRLAVTIAAAATIASGCTRQAARVTPGPQKLAPAVAAQGFPVTVTDTLGRRVTFRSRPRRIVSLAPAHTETLFALGVGASVLAVDTYSDYPPEVRGKQRINCWPRPPLEPLVALKPDLVVVFTEDATMVHRLERAGLPVLKLFPTTYDQTLDSIATLGQAVGATERARELVDEMRSRRAQVQRQVAGKPRPQVMLELDAMNPARPYVAGRGGLYGELLSLCGAENVFGDQLAPAAEVTSEAVLSRNPELILLGDAQSPTRPQTPELVCRRPGWNRLRAVRSGQVRTVNSLLLTRPSPRLAEGMEALADVLHRR